MTPRSNHSVFFPFRLKGIPRFIPKPVDFLLRTSKFSFGFHWIPMGDSILVYKLICNATVGKVRPARRTAAEVETHPIGCFNLGMRQLLFGKCDLGTHEGFIGIPVGLTWWNSDAMHCLVLAYYDSKSRKVTWIPSISLCSASKIGCFIGIHYVVQIGIVPICPQESQ